MQDERIDWEDAKQGPHKALATRPDSTLNPSLLEPAPDKRETDEDEINLLDYWRVLVKRKWTIITFLMIVVTAVVTATFLMTAIYRPALTMQIEREHARILQYQSVDPVESNAYQGYQAFYKTQYELLQSRSLAQRVIDKLSLAENPVFMDIRENPPFWKPITAWIKQTLSNKQDEAATEEQKPDLTKRFLQDLSVEPVKDSRLVKIYYESPDPELAARIVNTLADTFINMSLERRFDSSSYARTFLEERLQQIKAKLEDSERELADYARREQIINIDERRNISTQTLQDLNSALADAETQRIQTQAIYLQMQRASGHGLSQILESRVIQELKQLKAKLEAEYQDGLKLYKPAYPKMRQLAGRIAEVQNKISEEVGSIRSAIRADYEAATSNEGLLRAKLNEIKGEVMALQNRSIQYNILKREVDTNRQLYEGLLQRYKEVGVAGGVGTNNISIVDKAQVPAFPYKPSLALNSMLAIILGLFGGIVLAFVFEALDDTIKQTDDLERVVGIPALGVIPVVKQTRERNQDAEAIALLTQKDPRSAFAESYRSVRTALQFSTAEGPPRVLAITSPMASEGKSTTALSLAITFAQAGNKVLLIEADLRKPSLGRNLNMDKSNGLTNYLAGDAKPADIAQPALLPNLFVILAGPLPPNPVELLSTAKMLSLLSLSAEKFDQVIVDCPPVVGLADPLILGNMADSTLLVAEAGGTHRGAAQSALKRLKSARAYVLGAVLTKLDTRSGGYGYYHHYYYNYYYSEESSSKKRLTA